MQRISSVAILGGGPAASTLAILLARDGVEVTIFHRPKRAPLLVGESLVPAIIPLLRMLGVEEQVKSFSMFKPGATINIGSDTNFHFTFANIRGSLPGYAYNVPRCAFDDCLMEAARKAGAKIVETSATLERVGDTDRVQLSAETLSAAGSNTKPDWIVDATGRVRLLPNLLGISSRRGPRQDVALFAHLDRTTLDYEGHVHTTRLDHGWSWRIPLPGRVSLGVVIGKEFLPPFGSTAEEQYDNLLKRDSALRQVAQGTKRLTPVMEYSNYQLVSTRMVGEGWALVGDTAGFVDPVFSSGLWVGMKGAVSLASAIRRGTPEAFQQFELDTTHHLQCWHEIAGYFYDGRLFTSFQVGQMMMKNPLVRLVNPHITKHFSAIFTGAASNSRYSLGLLRFIVTYGQRNEDPRKMMIM